MKILKLPPMLLLSVLLLSACDEQGMCLKGEGEVETRTLELENFVGVRVGGSTRVFVERGDVQRVKVKGQPNVLNELETAVSGDVWDISFSRCLQEHETVEVYITVPELQSAKVGGAGYIELKDVFEGDEFNAGVSGSGNVKVLLGVNRFNSEVSGSGTITASGATREQRVSISGSGSHHAFDMSSQEAEVDISGSGEAQVDVRNTLEADISGSGRVYYRGSPDINKSISGSGKVIKKEKNT
ncbi:putative autotransporter adhesin-like protein [Pontibacter ummariensis]|uniref:Putative auto-transporter adhesin, head GIN domain n=1 Tax=Pontibacter ummariensis TaxID=1610492 RepID=A0A239JSM1_9BACT|nr:head GIN domain-containing protein [Pontibacter ummariensis]PRY07370.1 putative autotransporter adhesin-like protein [Pontibacter ummariensis]SNT07804.1 Putative auto-transporter adhesin, head GIN domain [Pontibacter ummariensis]